MMTKKTTPKDLFSGRRIKRVDTSACNAWRFSFDDGGVVEVEVEAVGNGLYGLITRTIKE